jgi:hypothetical protein
MTTKYYFVCNENVAWIEDATILNWSHTMRCKLGGTCEPVQRTLRETVYQHYFVPYVNSRCEICRLPKNYNATRLLSAMGFDLDSVCDGIIKGNVVITGYKSPFLDYQQCALLLQMYYTGTESTVTEPPKENVIRLKKHLLFV